MSNPAIDGQAAFENMYNTISDIGKEEFMNVLNEAFEKGAVTESVATSIMATLRCAILEKERSDMSKFLHG